MIIDTLENLEKYVAVNPLFTQVSAFVKSSDLQALPAGRIELEGDDLFLNVVEAAPKDKADARLETHRRMIDIQIPLTADETMGYAPLSDLAETTYDEADDISFYPEPAQQYITVKPGMFVVFFPEDAHAPAISSGGLRKIIFKVRA